MRHNGHSFLKKKIYNNLILYMQKKSQVQTGLILILFFILMFFMFMEIQIIKSVRSPYYTLLRLSIWLLINVLLNKNTYESGISAWLLFLYIWILLKFIVIFFLVCIRLNHCLTLIQFRKLGYRNVTKLRRSRSSSLPHITQVFCVWYLRKITCVISVKIRSISW